MFNFNWIEVLFIFVSSIFIFLVVIQANTSGSTGGLNSTNDGIMRVNIITKITAVFAFLLLMLAFFMNINNKNELLPDNKDTVVSIGDNIND